MRGERLGRGGAGLRRRALSLAPGVVFLVSAGLKAWSPASLGPLLRFAGLPAVLHEPLTLGVIGLEAALGMALVWFESQSLRAVALGVVAAFTGTLAIMLTVAEPPSCGCFGALRLFDSARTELLFGIGRNLVLAGLLFGLVTDPVGQGGEGDDAAASVRGGHRGRAASS